MTMLIYTYLSTYFFYTFTLQSSRVEIGYLLPCVLHQNNNNSSPPLEDAYSMKYHHTQHPSISPAHSAHDPLLLMNDILNATTIFAHSFIRHAWERLGLWRAACIRDYPSTLPYLLPALNLAYRLFGSGLCGGFKYLVRICT